MVYVSRTFIKMQKKEKYPYCKCKFVNTDKSIAPKMTAPQRLSLYVNLPSLSKRTQFGGTNYQEPVITPIKNTFV